MKALDKSGKSELKYKSWMVTILVGGGRLLPDPLSLEAVFNELSDKWVFQQERHENSDTPGKNHYQCAMVTKIRVRKSTLLKQLAELADHPLERIRVDKMEGTWEQALSYCSKADSRVEDKYFQRCSQSIKVELENKYNFKDLELVKNPDTRYPWQNDMINILFDQEPECLKTPDDRTIIWVTDREGCSGKSKLVKYLCSYNTNICKLSFGTANQLRSSVVSLGARQLYIIDIPRTLGSDDSLNDILSVIEDIKNGYVVSSFYGAYSKLICNPPHVVVFSNVDCPLEKLSKDRWKWYTINNKILTDKLQELETFKKKYELL